MAQHDSKCHTSWLHSSSMCQLLVTTHLPSSLSQQAHVLHVTCVLNFPFSSSIYSCFPFHPHRPTLFPSLLTFPSFVPLLLPIQRIVQPYKVKSSSFTFYVFASPVFSRTFCCLFQLFFADLFHSFSTQQFSLTRGDG